MEKIYKNVENKILLGKLDVNYLNTLRIIVFVMEELEKHDELSGEDKKRIAILVIKKVFKEYLNSNVNDEELSETIDTVIEITIGVYKINKGLGNKIKKLCCK
jgi:hypothetical protein